MQETSITVYGIRNCDTVKRARQWLQAHGRPHRFHDFKLDGVPSDLLDHWLQRLGWEVLLNRSGTTWRRLDEPTRAAVLDAGTARALMLAHPSVIKRPVVQWQDAQGLHVTVGFVPEQWPAGLNRASKG